MAHQISKYPLTTEEITAHKLPLPPELVPVVFKKCGHKAHIFSPGNSDPVGSFRSQWKATNAAPELEQKCWDCRRRA